MLRKRFLSKVLFIVILVAMSTINANAVTISLIPDSLNVGPGQQFNLNVVLNNPTSQGLVGIGIWIKYDKDLLNVVDADTGNWVTTGTNILDGSYHSSFNLPGDPGMFDNANDAGLDGEIRWIAGRSISDFTNIYPSGTFATITFQAESNLDSAVLAFYGAGTGGYPDTYVMNEAGEQILTSTYGATVNIVPEPTSLLLIGMGLAIFGNSIIRRKE